ncbi:MAG: alanine dehydrogenase [Betaproteobacteria bacterium]|nr:MAG: alanine dehydrogenase [Betaproteobacteria bacterium]
MRVGLPKEVKDGEFRVALTPAAVASLRNVIVESGAGAGVGFSDEDYVRAGAALGDPWSCELVVKVKELQESEYGKPRSGQTVFSFQHFGPEPRLLDAALASGATFIAFETVGQESGLPILAPMSAIAGRLAVQVGAWCLQKHNGGSGVLLSGLDGVPPGKVAILGAGNVGGNALALAHGMGAEVTVFAKTDKRFHELKRDYPRARYRAGFDADIVAGADLVIGGVLTPGRMSPKLVSRGLLRRMRRGSALVDVGIDQGGIAETSRPTSHSEPIYLEEGVVHYCVPNLPAACARTASLALERAVMPFIGKIVRNDVDEALASGIQVRAGRVTHAHLARDTGRAYSPP